jgi:hypothetical protein
MRQRTCIRLAVALVALAGPTGPALAAGATGVITRAFSGSGVAFRYPAAWHASPPAWRWRSSFSVLVTYLATGELHDPCARTASSTTCSSPLAVLAPGGVLITWTRGRMPSWSLARQPGRPITLAGHPGKLQIAHPGACRALQATETVTAQISLGPKSDSLQMQACLRGSNARANEARVRAMLVTLRVSR